MEVLLAALGGETAARARRATRSGARSTAGFALIEDGGTALVEVAQASGLALVRRGRARRRGRVDARAPAS